MHREAPALLGAHKEFPYNIRELRQQQLEQQQRRLSGEEEDEEYDYGYGKEEEHSSIAGSSSYPSG